MPSLPSDAISLFAYLGVPVIMAGYFVWWTTAILTTEITRNTRAVTHLALVIARSQNIDASELADLCRMIGNGNK